MPLGLTPYAVANIQTQILNELKEMKKKVATSNLSGLASNIADAESIEELDNLKAYSLNRADILGYLVYSEAARFFRTHDPV